jgi:hypothetical protein
MTRKLLIMVHPGSACGSADFNVGQDLAPAFRHEMIRDLDGWNGDILVLDNFLGDELSSYPDFERAIIEAVARNSAEGHYAAREFGCDNFDPHTSATLSRLIREGVLDPAAPVRLTGSSYDPDDLEGCVNGVYDTLAAAGFRDIEVLDSAMPIGPDGFGGPEDEDVEEMGFAP